MIIGVTGTLGAGKGTIVDYLVKEKEFKHYSCSGFITEEIVRRGLEVNRDSMVSVGNDLRMKYGPGYVAASLYDQAKKKGCNAVIESIRTEGEVNTLKEKDKFTLFAVDANQRIRYERNKKRESSKDNISYEKFQEQEATEMTSTDPHKQNLSRCKELADYTFINDGTFEELYQKIEKALENFGYKNE
ncbi:AAA family ATPase [Candidatus Woesearchaeota archaeon]|nr:AAA family ATPase [Candidatus Woesearchaeota archaeon]